MILSAFLRPSPEALGLLEDLRTNPNGRTGDEVVQMLQAWRLQVEDCVEPAGSMFVVHEEFVRLQMGIARRGYIHSGIVERAIGLIDSLRVLLADVTYVEEQKTE